MQRHAGIVHEEGMLKKLKSILELFYLYYRIFIYSVFSNPVRDIDSRTIKVLGFFLFVRKNKKKGGAMLCRKKL